MKYISFTRSRNSYGVVRDDNRVVDLGPVFGPRRRT